MTTLTAPTDAHPSVRVRDTRLTFGGVVRSEWVKLRSLRSTVWSYAIVVVISLGMAFLMSWSIVNGAAGEVDVTALPAEQQRDTVIQAATFGTYFGQLVVGVLGVLVISGEYTTGMIRSTLTAVPKRIPALAGKAIVLFAATFVVGLVASVGGYLTASVVLGTGLDLADPVTLLSIAGSALYLALVALLALGIGTMLRSSAGGIAAVLGLLLLVPMVLGLIPAEWAQDLGLYLPSSTGLTMFTAIGADDADLVGPNAWQSLLIVLGWVGASLVGAAALLKRRDA